MSDDSPLSPTLRALCEAAERLLKKFPEGSERGQTPGSSVAAPADLVDAIYDHMGRYHDLNGRLCDEGTHLDYLVGGKAAAAEVFSSVGRIEVILNHTRRNLDAVRAWRDDPWRDHPKAKLVRGLLADMHRYQFDQIRGMVREIAEALREPVAALERRGLPTTGEVTLRFDFELTDSPQHAALKAWAERQARREEKSGGSWGCLGAVLLAALLVWWLGG